MPDNDEQLFLLTKAASRSPELFEDPIEWTWGPSPHIEFESIRIKLGRRPMVYPITQLYDKLGKEIPKEYTMYVSYDIWIVTMVVGILKEGGWKNVTQLGCQIEYPETPKVTILEMLPQTEFIQKASGMIYSNSSISLNGSAAVDDSVLGESQLSELASGSFKLDTANEVSLAANLKYSVLTTKVITTGVGDNCGEWLFKKHDKPLLGDQHFTHTLLVPSEVQSLKLKARLYANVGGFASLPVRLVGEWETLEVEVDL